MQYPTAMPRLKAEAWEQAKAFVEESLADHTALGNLTKGKITSLVTNCYECERANDACHKCSIHRTVDGIIKFDGFGV